MTKLQVKAFVFQLLSFATLFILGRYLIENYKMRQSSLMNMPSSIVYYQTMKWLMHHVELT